MTGDPMQPHVVVIGGGFTGLAAAWELAGRGVRVTLCEADPELGGLAGSFEVGGTRLEKFYHHWFTNDRHVIDLVHELDRDDQVLHRPTRTGMYFAHRFFRLSKPQDVLRFSPLRWRDRLRLGLLALRARRVRDWRALEDLTAEEWLTRLGGPEVFRVVWQPLLEGKFGPFASEISAVWFWNKLKLRGGSRGRAGEEVLAYYRGGFAALADELASAIQRRGGVLRLNTPVLGLDVRDGRVTGVVTPSGTLAADAVIATPALPVVADLVEPHVEPEYVRQLRRIEYLANLCVVLELDRSLSETYWLNVNDPGFPFVGVIEHTNFEPASTYEGRHLVYLSKYLPESHELYRMGDEELLEFSLQHLQRMFPALERSWILGSHVWRARFSQPIVVRRYGSLIPAVTTPVEGLYLSTMAQVYPEDRGTNYAIREGRETGRLVAGALTGRPAGAAVRCATQAETSDTDAERVAVGTDD
ncbi:MAG TPA: NAD(P)/FAD-dependent oxidoreductase [Gemmatimonadales bacterium]|nr:NAD(P)/FAD-dependent oxidoreductase [Gemmatimonadales bacterium]